MSDITKQLVKGLKVTKNFEISPAKDDSRVKRFKLELTIDNVTVYDMALGLLTPEVIKVQNSKRPSWDKLVEGTTFKKTFMKPMAQVDPEEAMIARLRSMSPEDMKAELERLAKLATK